MGTEGTPLHHRREFWCPSFRGAMGSGCCRGSHEAVMNEDTFNTEVRKFLKQVGVTSQREIESAVREAVEAGRLKGDEKLKASARVQIEGIGLDHRVEGEIALS